MARMSLLIGQPHAAAALGDPRVEVPVPPRQGATEPVPPLENGDRLTRNEFERRYHAMPDVKKAELIEGIVYMPAPVRLRRHGQPHSDAVIWLGTYRLATPGVLQGDNSTARLDLDNEPQPDVLLMVDPDRGGQAKISPDDYVEGAPELVCEVAASSATIDLHFKFNVFRRNGVREYVVWVTGEKAVRWFVLSEGRFDPLAPDADGIVRSRVFPGLWLDPVALTAGNMARVMDVVRAGTASPEHAAFAAKLNAPPAAPPPTNPARVDPPAAAT